MKGDFSRLHVRDEEHVTGVLHQQGRVLLDADWNAQAGLAERWQDDAARDAIGRGVLAVPAQDPDAFRVLAAERAEDHVLLRLAPGRAWADGLVVRLAATGDDEGISRVAPYMGPPLPAEPPPPGAVVAGDRDLVVLEVWRETLSAFQPAESWLEPALGGVDTTARVLTALRPRLLRLADGESCAAGLARIERDRAPAGRLTVTLHPPDEEDGECPTEAAGGYLGFEHHLFRVEVARVDAGDPAMIMWSRFNGGLVGRGQADLGNGIVDITGNLQPIRMAGLDRLYMEIIERDPDPSRPEGIWRTVYGADVRIDGDALHITDTRFTGVTTPTGSVFFRLWDGIRPIAELRAPSPGQEPTSLVSGLGIRLEMDLPEDVTYVPGEYWTFPVRAGVSPEPDGSGGFAPLVDAEPAHGPTVHRVPMAILEWDEGARVTAEDGQIRDCRNLFRPLTAQDTCCSFRVGDGVASFGDFNSIGVALAHLPDAGGELCLLPGTHRGGVRIADRANIRIRGCGERTRVLPATDALEDPVFHVLDSSGIRLDALDIIAARGTGIRIEEREPGSVAGVELTGNRILALERGIDVRGGRDVAMRANTIRIVDRDDGGVGIVVQGDDVVVVDNDVRVVPAEANPQPPEDDAEPTEPPVLNDCVSTDELFDDSAGLVVYGMFAFAWTYVDAGQAARRYRARGGIQVRGGSERVVLRANRVSGGAGNGITLGSDVDLTTLLPTWDAEEVTLDHGDGPIEALVIDATTHQPVDDLELLFLGDDYPPLSATTAGEDGGQQDGVLVTDTAEPGRYRVASIDPGYQVRSAEAVETDQGRGAWVIRVTQTEQPPTNAPANGQADAPPDGQADAPANGQPDAPPDAPDAREAVALLLAELAFIHDLTIEDNHITLMGRSGIGLPPLHIPTFELTDAKLVYQVISAAQGMLGWLILAVIFGVLAAPVHGLVIARNRIRDCLNAPPVRDPDAPPFLPPGEGGISLGVTERVRIEDNTIEENGLALRTPACGVYVLTAERLEVSGNRMAGNGPSGPAASGRGWAGFRGGIVVLLASGASVLEGMGLEDDGGDGDGAALRVHGNVVRQPLGPALMAAAWGPATIQDNRLHTHTADRTLMGGRVGAVLLANLGGMDRTFQTTAALSQESNTDTSTVDMAADAKARHPSGDTMFANNQVRLDLRDGVAVAQLIVTMDDLAYSENQGEVRGPGIDRGPSLNAFLCGATIRTLGNRFKEPPPPPLKLSDNRPPPPVYSAVTLALLLNNTSNNQGDHCILAGTYLAAPPEAPESLMFMANQWLFQRWGSCQAENKALAEGNINILFRTLSGLFRGS